MASDRSDEVLRRMFLQRQPAPDTLGIEQPEWVAHALCAQMGDVSAFYPEKGGATSEAKLICSLCPVRAECLEWALEIEARSAYCYGVWGG